MEYYTMQKQADGCTVDVDFHVVHLIVFMQESSRMF
jgi:hypothetical protein